MNRHSFMVLVAVAASVAFASSACGGGKKNDDFSDIKATATAAALKSPTPAATVDPVTAYYQQAAVLAKDLSDLSTTLNSDMLAAAGSQGDPKWPAQLTSDADLVIAKAAALNKLPVPAGVPQTLAGRIGQAAQGLGAGAELLKQAILKLDPAIGAQSAETLDAAKTLLEGVRTDLAALQKP